MSHSTSYWTVRVFLFAILALTSAPASQGQAPPGVHVETQVETLMNITGSTGLGNRVSWNEPFLVVANANHDHISLYRRTVQGWNRLHIVEADLSPLTSTFASDLSASGDWYFVADGNLEDPIAGAGRGAVFVFRREGERLVRVETLLPPLLPLDPLDPFVNASLFGFNVSADGEWLVVTAPIRDGVGEGAAFIYRLVGGSWILSQELRSTIPGTVFFGTSAQIHSSGFLAIGQSLMSQLLVPFSPSNVHTYRLIGDIWTLDEVILDPEPYPNTGVDRFAVNLALSPDGQTLVVADPHACESFFTVLGEAYVFERDLSSSAPGWNLVASLMPSNNFQPSIGSGVGIQFGASMLLDGDSVYIGANRSYGLVDGVPDGAVYGFERSSGGVWSSTETIRFVVEIEDGHNTFGGQLLGTSLAFDGATLISAPGGGPEGLRIFEVNAARTICNFVEPTPSLEVLRPTHSDVLTVALHNLPPGAPVQLLASLTYSRLPGTSVGGVLCLGGQVWRIEQTQFAGSSGSLYLDSLASVQHSVTTGTLLGLQAWYRDASGFDAFSDAAIILCE